MASVEVQISSQEYREPLFMEFARVPCRDEFLDFEGDSVPEELFGKSFQVRNVLWHCPMDSEPSPIIVVSS